MRAPSLPPTPGNGVIQDYGPWSTECFSLNGPSVPRASSVDSNVQERPPYTTERQRRAAPHKIKVFFFCLWNCHSFIFLRQAEELDPTRAPQLTNNITEKISSMVPRGWGGEGGMNSGEYSLLLFRYYVILPKKVKRTRKIQDRNTK